MSDAGTIERHGKRIQRLGSGSISEHRWYLCPLQGVRWLQVIADGIIVRGLQSDQEDPLLSSAEARVPRTSEPAQGLARSVVQLALFVLSEGA